VLDSVSRVNRDICTPEEIALASRTRETLALYRKNEDLISVGAYQRGTNPALDEAILRQEPLRNFLRQQVSELIPRAATFSRLKQLLS
jgi:flagellum-specific ATP synthase